MLCVGLVQVPRGMYRALRAKESRIVVRSRYLFRTYIDRMYIVQNPVCIIILIPTYYGMKY